MTRRRCMTMAAIVCVAICGASGTAVADEQSTCPICSKASSDASSYPAKAGTTLAQGATNALLGWTELIRQPVDEVKAGGNIVTGVGKGVSQTVKRTLGGVAELLTFWTPKIDNHYLHFTKDCPVCMKNNQAK